MKESDTWSTRDRYEHGRSRSEAYENKVLKRETMDIPKPNHCRVRSRSQTMVTFLLAIFVAVRFA